MAIKPSVRFATVLLLSHAIAASVVYMTAMPWTARLAVLLLIVLSLSYYLARDAFLIFLIRGAKFHSIRAAYQSLHGTVQN